MDQAAILKKIAAGVIGKVMRFRRGSDLPVEHMRIIEVRAKKSGNAIFIGESFSIGFFTPIHMFSIIKKETEDGWDSGGILSDVTVGGIPSNMAFTFILDE